MSKSPIAFLLLKKIGTYLAHAEPKSRKGLREHKEAAQAFDAYCRLYYPAPILKCAEGKVLQRTLLVGICPEGKIRQHINRR